MSAADRTDGAFPETRWTRVLAVRHGIDASPDADQALSELCASYWPPIYAYARRMGETPGVMLGSGVARNAAALRGAAARPLPADQPRTEDIWTLALHAVYDHDDIEPLYIRPCDAVDVLSAGDHARLEAEADIVLGVV